MYFQYVNSRKTKITNWVIIYLIFWMTKFNVFFTFFFFENNHDHRQSCCSIFSFYAGAPEQLDHPDRGLGIILGNSEIFCHFQKYKAQVCRTNGSKLTSYHHFFGPFWTLFGSAMSFSIFYSNVNIILNEISGIWSIKGLKIKIVGL